MKRSDLNHLRRLVAWARCEIGQPPDEHVATVQHLAERSVPKYVRDAVKALDRYARPPGAVVDDQAAPRLTQAAKEAKG